MPITTTTEKNVGTPGHDPFPTPGQDPLLRIAEPNAATYYQFSREELKAKAIEWMKANADGCSKEWYFTRLGMLIEFCHDLTAPPR